MYVSAGIGLLFREISDSILIAWLHLSSYRSLELSIYRLSTFVKRLSSIICLSVHLVDGCCLLAPHLSDVAVGRRNFVAAVCDACRHLSPCPVAGTGLLVTTRCRLSPVFVIVDEGCDWGHASTSWPSFLSSQCYWFEWARAVELLHSVWGTVSRVGSLTSMTGSSPSSYHIIVLHCPEMS